MRRAQGSVSRTLFYERNVIKTNETANHENRRRQMERIQIVSFVKYTKKESKNINIVIAIIIISRIFW
jgi:hypothetical protein